MPDRYDLNLLVALDALLAEGSVTKAAERVNLSVPAMSRALGRLRREFQDPLLVKVGRGFVPTNRALEISERVHHLLIEADALVSEHVGVDPAQLDRDFRIIASEPVLVFITGPMLAYFEKHAPRSRVAFMAKGTQLVMREAPIDLGIGVIRSTEPGLQSEVLMVDRIVGVCRQDHPLLDAPITYDRYRSASHLANSRTGQFVGVLDPHFHLDREIAAAAPLVSLFPALLATDLVGICFEALEGGLADRIGLVTFELPYDVEPEPVYLEWHPRHESDPKHMWLRESVRTVVEEALAKAALRRD